jgi:hypothetical protein
MPLVTDCPYCGHTSRLRESLIGKKVICPKCRGVFLVTDPTAADATPAEPARTYYDVEESRSVSPRVIAFSISGILLAASAFIVLLLMAQQSGKLPRQPQASRSQRQFQRQPQPSRQDGTDSDEQLLKAAVTTYLMWLAFWAAVAFVALVVNVILMIWTVKDARNRGDDNGVMWMFVVFLLGLLGLIIYLAARRPGSLVTCDQCHNRRLSYTTSCPHCGIKTA